MRRRPGFNPGLRRFTRRVYFLLFVLIFLLVFVLRNQAKESIRRLRHRLAGIRSGGAG